MVKYLINEAPDLLKEWDYEKNKDIDINKIASGSVKKYWWKCPEGHSYYTTPHSRVIKNSKCNECHLIKKRIQNKEIVNKMKSNKTNRKNTTILGDETENYVLNLLKNTMKYKNVEKIGHLGGKADICITNFDNSLNYIQVKTLIERKDRKDTYMVKIDKKYLPNMLIVLVNKKRNRFALDFAKNVKIQGLNIPFSNLKSKYKNICYKNEKDFLYKLQELIPLSSNINEIYEDNLKEINMLKRFENFCIDNNIFFKRNDTNGNTVDGYINGYTFQAKYVSFPPKGNIVYRINSRKSCGVLNKKIVRKNYEKGDFDFFVVEIGGTRETPEKYHSNFLIFSEEKLIEKCIIETENNKGKEAFQVCPPDYEKKTLV